MELLKSKLLERRVKKAKELDEYYVEECDGKVQHWVHCNEGYVFPETETVTICGFNVREINKQIQNTMTAEEFYGAE
jgi:hypothetical protein